MDILSMSNNRTADMYKQQMATQSIDTAFERGTDNMNDEELKEACIEFEAYFINMMFKEMRKTINRDSSLIPESQGERIFTEMMDEDLSKNIANGSNGLGIAQTLYNQMQHANTGVTYAEYLAQQQQVNNTIE